jgi:hypothetical protein
MATEIPFDTSGTKATYNTATQTLLVMAEGIVPNKVLSPAFNRQTFMGGRKLAVVSNIGGKPGPDKRVTFKYQEDDIATPRFQSVIIVTLASWNSSRLVETPVPITTINVPAPTPAPIVPLKPQPLPTLPKTNPNTLRKSIPIALPLGNVVRITTAIPDPTLFSFTIEARTTDTDALVVWRAGALPGTLYWDLTWDADKVNELGATFVVTTTQSAIGQANAPVQVTAQPYAVKVA